jgi:hypothetical protein
MVDSVHQADGRLDNPSVRHERTDVSFRAIVVVLIAALVFAALTQFVLLVFFYGYRDYQNDIKKSPHPLAPTPMTSLPPEPRLEQLDRQQGYESPGTYAREAPQEERLLRYGPTDEDAFVHIPIEKAIALLENKLPARQPQSAQERRRAGGLVHSGDPNSGRMFREKQ